MAKKSKKETKLDAYLKMDISSLIKKKDYQTLREMEKYLNRMARQRLSRLEKAHLKDTHRSKIIKGYSSLDFQTSYIPKYKLTNKELKKYHNQILKSISNAKAFLGKKSSLVSSYKKWVTTNKKVGLKFKTLEEAKAFYDFWLLIEELCGDILESLSSTEQYHVIMAIQGRISKSRLKWRENRAYNKIEERFKNSGPGTKEYRMWEDYFKKK